MARVHGSNESAPLVLLILFMHYQITLQTKLQAIFYIITENVRLHIYLRNPTTEVK